MLVERTCPPSGNGLWRLLHAHCAERDLVGGSRDQVVEDHTGDAGEKVPWLVGATRASQLDPVGLHISRGGLPPGRQAALAAVILQGESRHQGPSWQRDIGDSVSSAARLPFVQKLRGDVS